MPRNGSGAYSLPAGNPVVEDTTVEPDWANDTLNDIAEELTNSLDRTGAGPMLAPLETPDGTKALPAHTFENDPDCGLYRAGAADLRMSVNDTDVQQWTPTGNTFYQPVTAQKGVIATQSTADTPAVQGTGNGTGQGVLGNGGTSGAGVKGIGGSAAGSIGVHGVGGATDGVGGKFEGVGNGHAIQAVAANGAALSADGGTSASDVIGATAVNGTGYCCILTGNATKAPLRIVGRAGAPSSPDNGAIYYDTTTNKLRVYAGGAWTDLH